MTSYFLWSTVMDGSFNLLTTLRVLLLYLIMMVCLSLYFSFSIVFYLYSECGLLPRGMSVEDSGRSLLIILLWIGKYGLIINLHSSVTSFYGEICWSLVNASPVVFYGKRVNEGGDAATISFILMHTVAFSFVIGYLLISVWMLILGVGLLDVCVMKSWVGLIIIGELFTGNSTGRLPRRMSPLNKRRLWLF